MSRRRLVVIASASVMLLLGLAVAGVFVGLTRTTRGRAYIQQNINALLRARLAGHGRLYIGRITGNLLTEITLDSVALYDEEDSVIVATGRFHATYDPRNLLDKRLIFDQVEVQHPRVNLRKRADRRWNYEHVFAKGPKSSTPSLPVRTQRGYGDNIVLHAVSLRHGLLTVTDLWSPPDTLRGAKLDSAIAASLADPTHEIRRTREGVKKTLRWSNLDIVSPYVRLSHPDTAGRLIVADTLNADWFDPPFQFRNVHGPVRILGDTVTFDLSHFDLAASTGHGTGRIWWPPGPLRFDMHISGDSVSLSDVAWVYKTLPREGRGTMQLAIHNNARDPHIMEYALTRLDVRSTKSRLTGTMTFGVGSPVLIVKDVALEANPVDFDLFRVLNGGPFPVDWQGTLTGSLRGRGGPVNRFVLDASDLTFRDAHVPGAVTRMKAAGMMDILSPGRTVFRGLDVELGRLDLRTIQYLFASFPRLHGTADGVATLDSIWDDVRFRNASITLRDGPATPSHFTGSGRVTEGREFTAFDVSLLADPISFTTFARTYPGLPFRGEFTGPLRIQGTTPSMDIDATLAGPAGTMHVDGHFDLFAPMYAADATGDVRALDPRLLFDRPDYVPALLTGSFDADLRGDSLPNLDGSLALSVEHSTVNGIDLLPSAAGLRFGSGKLSIDSMRVTSTSGELTANGSLGLVPEVSDSLRYRLTVDSLGGLRPLLQPPAAGHTVRADGATSGVPGSSEAAADSDSASWRGFITAEGVLTGSTTVLATHGTLRGGDFAVGENVARRLAGRYEFQDMLRTPHGQASASLDSVMASGVRLATVQAEMASTDASRGRARFAVRSEGQPWQLFTGTASMAYERDSSTLALSMDTLDLLIVDHQWSLAAPARLLVDPTGTTIPSLSLRTGGGAAIGVQASLPLTAPIQASLRADSVPLQDLGVLGQATRPLDGRINATLDVTGTRGAPEMRYDARVDGARFGELSLPFFTMRGGYAARRFNGTLLLFRNTQPVLSVTGSLPVDLALEARARRLLDDSLALRARADSVDLGLIEAISPMFSKATGVAVADLRVGGTFDRPTVGGQIAVHNGEVGLPRMGIRLQQANADIGFARDSIFIRRFSARSGASGDTISLTGAISVPNYATIKHTGFDLNLEARTFSAFDRKALQRLQVSGNARLSGQFERSTLSGFVLVDRGTLYLPVLARKEIINLDDPDFSQVVDTTFGQNSGILLNDSPLLREFLQHLEVPGLAINVGQDVWLRSEEANIKLGGAVDLRYRTADSTELPGHQGHTRWNGSLQVVRGTYRLDLGLVQRTFQVDSGRVTFYGDPDIPEEISIWATYTVRRVDQPDIRIMAHISGTLNQPKLDLQSDQQYALSYSEILSYLVFGQPTFTLGADAAAALQPVASALLPTIGGVLERALADQIGIFDVVQLQTGGVSGFSTLNTGQTLISGSRIGVGKQLGERTFVSANAGLCQLVGTNQTGNVSFIDALGISIEYRLNHGLTLQASSEPSSTALACGRTDTRNTPRQYGFDLFRDWTF
jgi:translocation and assembly module TamB